MVFGLRARAPHLLAATLLLVLLSPAVSPRALITPVQAALTALEGGEPAAAAEWFGQATQFEPSFGALHLQAAQAALAAGDLERARTLLLTAEELLPSGHTECMHGVLLLEDGDLAGAFRELEAGPGCLEEPSTLHRIAEAAIAAGDRPLAVRSLQALTQVLPADPQVRLRLALLQATEDPERAIPELRLADELAAEGSALAQSLIRAITEAQPVGDPAYTLVRVGQTLGQAGEWSAAAFAFQQAGTHRDPYPEAEAYLGLALELSGRNGLGHLTAAVQDAPGLAISHALLGRYWRAHGQYRQAIQELEQAARLDPSSPAIAADLALAYEWAAELPEAQAAYRLAAELDPQSSALWLLLATFCLSHEIEVSTTGVLAARNAVALAPADPLALDALGFAHLLLGHLDLADRLLSRSILLAPGRAGTQYHLGLLRLAQNRTREAHAALRLAAEIDREGAIGAMAERTLEGLERQAPPAGAPE